MGKLSGICGTSEACRGILSCQKNVVMTWLCLGIIKRNVN